MTSGRNVRGARKVCPKPPDDLSEVSGHIVRGVRTNLYWAKY